MVKMCDICRRKEYDEYVVIRNLSLVVNVERKRKEIAKKRFSLMRERVVSQRESLCNVNCVSSK